MAVACRRVLGAEDIKSSAKTGQNWYDSFKASAESVRCRNGDGYMPGSWLLLQMLDKAEK
ncbi:MAG TPA: hypothetical protein DD811_10425 [Syntrophomonas sp.]|jgi:hypothetical protein|nr:hypothetical protein [Bacillota bacterium]HBQ86877.1 hypothetical protein [Syntrophomonas sp.]